MAGSYTKSQHSMQGAFVFVLLGLFALMSTLMVLLGAQMYRATVDHSQQNNQKRLLSAYAFSDLVETASTTDDSEHFAHIDGIGPERSALIVEWFHNEENAMVLNDLLSLIEVNQQQQQRSGNQCEGLTFVITGDVHHFKNRNELKAYIEARGGKVAGSVSGSTSFLINNDVTSTSGKNKKAKELGIPILSEDDFLSQFGLTPVPSIPSGARPPRSLP